MIFKFKEFKQLFIDDFEENLQKINVLLLELEKRGEDIGICNELLGLTHNIKGASASVGFTKTAELAHEIEAIFDQIKKGKLTLSSKIFEGLFIAVDFLQTDLANIKNNNTEIESKEIISILQVLPLKNAKSLSLKPKLIPQKSQQKNLEVNSVKISSEKIDTLMQEVGSLLIHNMNLKNTSKVLNDKFTNNEDIMHLQEIYHDISLTIEELKNFALDISLVEIQTLFSNLPRIVRDAEKILNKEIELEILGGEIKVDRIILNKLYNPLVHLVRNAADHGVDKKGKISIKAYQKKDFVEISIFNTGKKINFKKLLEIGLQKKIIQKEEKENLEKLIPSTSNSFIPTILKDFLCRKYISSSEKATELSGRGAGLPQVQEFIDKINGNLLIQTNENGTTMVIQIPYSISLIKVLLFKISKNIFGIPLIYLDEIKNNQEDDKTIPEIKISEESSQEFSEIIQIQINEQKAKIKTSNIVGIEDILLKPLPDFIFEKKLLTGITLLDSAQVGLILDIPSLLRDQISKISSFKN